MGTDKKMQIDRDKKTQMGIDRGCSGFEHRALSSFKAHYNRANSKTNNINIAPKKVSICSWRKTAWVKVIALVVVAVFVWQNAALAYSYKGPSLYHSLDSAFEERSWGDVMGEATVGAALTYVGANLGSSFSSAASSAGLGTAAANAVGYGLSGALTGAAGAAIYGGDIGKGALIGGVGGGIGGGVSGMDISGFSGAVYGAGIGAVAGAGVGYLLDGEQGAWMYGLQGAVAGGMAGYTNTDSSSTSSIGIDTNADSGSISLSNNTDSSSIGIDQNVDYNSLTLDNNTDSHSISLSNNTDYSSTTLGVQINPEFSSATLDNLKQSLSNLNQSSWSRLKNNPVVQEIALGMATAMVMDSASRAVAGEVFLSTYDSETGAYDVEKAERLSIIASAAVGGLMNPRGTLGLDPSSQDNAGSGQGALAMMGKGLVAGTITGLGSAYAVEAARDRFSEDSFETLRPAIQQLGGLAGLGLGRAVVDKTTYMPSAGTYQLAGQAYDIHKPLAPETELSAIGADGNKYDVSIEETPISLLQLADKDETKARQLAYDLERGELDTHLIPLDPKTLQIKGTKPDIDIDTELTYGEYEIKGADGRFVDIQIDSQAPTLREAASGNEEVAKDWLNGLTQLPLPEGKEFDPGSRTIYEAAYRNKIGRRYVLPIGQDMDDRYVELYLNERASPGQIALNLTSAPFKAIGAEWYHVAGTLAQSYAQKEFSGRGTGAKYAFLGGESARNIATAGAQWLANSSGAVYREPLDELRYNLDMKQQFLELGQAAKVARQNRVQQMSDDERWDYIGSDIHFKDAEANARYETIREMSPQLSADEVGRELGFSEYAVNGRRAWSIIRHNFLSRTAAGLATLHLDKLMAQKAPEYWGGESSSPLVETYNQKEFNEWKAKQSLNRAYTLNLASSAIHGAALYWAGERDADIWTKRAPIRQRAVGLSVGDFVDYAANPDIWTKRAPIQQRERSLIVTGDVDYANKVKKGTEQEYQLRSSNIWEGSSANQAQLYWPEYVKVGGQEYWASEVLGYDERVKREGNVLVIPRDVLESKFQRQWALDDQPLELGESIAMAMGGSQMAALKNGLSFGYSNVKYTPFGWTKYLSDAQNIAPVFSSKAAMTNYWANVYAEGAKDNLAGAAATFQPLANTFAVMPERAVIRPLDPQYPDRAGYRIFFKNISDADQSRFRKAWDYAGPRPRVFLTPEALQEAEQEEQSLFPKVESAIIEPLLTPSSLEPANQAVWRGLNNDNEH